MRIDVFKNLDINTITKWYNENEKTLIIINELLNEELGAFADQTAKNRIVFFTTRIKKLQSLLDKIALFNESKNRNLINQINERNLNPQDFKIQDIINDMVGARIVFYFEPDLPSALIYFLTYPIFNTIDVKVYDFLNVVASHPFNISTRLIDIAKSYKQSIKKSVKQSGYESSHIIIKYNYDLLKQKVSKMDNKKISDNMLRKVSEFPIEIQIRSLMQHGWAQIEHTCNYSEKKKVIKVKHISNVNQDDFIVNKFISIGVEQHQNQIWAKYWSRNEEEGIISKESIPSGDRFAFFTDNEQDILSNFQKSIIHNIRKLEYKYFKKLKNLINTLDSKYKLLEDDIPVVKKKWGQRRAIILLIGYIALFNERKLNEKLLLELLEMFSLRMTDDIRINLIALYEYVRKVDTLFRIDKVSGTRNIFFFDALVSYRAAGIHFITGNSRRALNLMVDCLAERDENMREGLEEPKKESSLINKMHIKRRIAEYYWRAYNQDNRTDNHDLIMACSYINDAYREIDKPLETKLNTEKRKILSKIIIYNLFAFKIGIGNLDENGYLQLITYYSDDIIALLKEKENDLLNKDNGSLGLEALAIYLWINNDINNAKRLICIALDRVLVKSSFAYVIHEIKEVKLIIETQRIKPIK